METESVYLEARRPTERDLADFLTLGAGVRQSNLATTSSFVDVNGHAKYIAAINAVSEQGAALRNRQQDQNAVMLSDADSFNPQAVVNRSELAYSFVQSLALESFAKSFNGDITAIYGDQRVTLADQGDIPQELKGYVQLALDLGILGASFDIQQGVYDLEPSITARFNSHERVSRADYAVAATRFYNNYQ